MHRVSDRLIENPYEASVPAPDVGCIGLKEYFRFSSYRQHHSIIAALVKEAVTDVIDKERHGVREGSARIADEDSRYGDKPTSRRTEGPAGGVNVDPNLEGSTALAICGRSLMARAVGMTKKPANREGLGNQQVLERILHFRFTTESMSGSGRLYFTAIKYANAS